ncbi:MAG: hypothetical protein E6Q25_09860, partial [Acinetobacter sp.]
AVAGLPQPTRSGASMLSVGTGAWNGEQAIAIGVSGITSNDKFIYKAAGTTNTEGDSGGNFSVGWQW